MRIKTLSNKRIFVYLVLFSLFFSSVVANFLLYRREPAYVLARPVDASQLYSEKQISLARNYLDLEPVYALQKLNTRLDRELVLPSLDTTFDKMEAIALYLFSKIEPHQGSPLPLASMRSGLKLLEEMLAGDTWSDAIARVYVTLANAAGVASRLVHLTLPGEQKERWFAESYVSEQKKWAFVDLRYRKLYIEDFAGEVVSAAELLAAVNQGDIDHLEVALFEGGSVVYRPYLEHSASEKFFFQPKAALQYPRAKELQPTLFSLITRYLYAPGRVFTLDWSPFVQWGWIKLSLLSLTALLGSALIILLSQDLSAQSK